MAITNKLTAIANAIRGLLGTSETYTLETMASTINNISRQAATTIDPLPFSRVAVGTGKYTTGDITVGPNIIDINTSAGMDAVKIDANMGKLYRYTGTTDSKYVNGRLYWCHASTIGPLYQGGI